jgi:drug/metabolite transporter (DMT)-like permease
MFWPAFGIAVTGVVLAPVYWVTPAVFDLLLFAAAGMFGSMGIVCLTHAFRLAPAALVSPFEYSALVWATVLGYLLWDDLPDRYTVAGAGIIIASGLYILYRETIQRGKARPVAPAISPDDPTV